MCANEQTRRAFATTVGADRETQMLHTTGDPGHFTIGATDRAVAHTKDFHIDDKGA